MDHDLDDTHLCIKCSETIVGLDNYIQHRKQNCTMNRTTREDQTKITAAITNTSQQHNAEVTPGITYEPFQFNETEPPTSTSGGKTSKSLGESYELPYELEADVFFSSLQLQSVQSSVGQQVPSTTGGKTGSTQTQGPLTRQKSLPQECESTGQVEETWINIPTTEAAHASGRENFLKAVSVMGETKKSYETIFKPITFEHESPEVSEEEDEDEVDVDMDDDDEDYDPMAEAHGSGGKWKPPQMRHSPPVVPMTHTGGKWKPEHRPNLRVAHSQLSRVSPTWDDHLDDMDVHESQHPPSDHTKGKWIPGTKLQRLEYKEVVELAKCSSTSQDYWCNICCRKLKSKTIYENHLKTSYHLKRAEPELQLEKAAIEELPREEVNKSFSLVEFKPLSITLATNAKKRKRRSTYLKCSLCKHVMTRHLIGKHLISHYHYRRMQLHPAANSLRMILDNIHAIVLQSPFQCRPCRFYSNTEETFLLHWNSAMHLDCSEGPGRFWCSYCQFECEDNNQMRRHLLGPDHKEVLLAINRSVPICISKRITIDCPKCGAVFRFNFELKRHILSCHRDMALIGTAADSYQSKFKCELCTEVLPSQTALQRHQKNKHFVSKYFCSICSLEFNSPCKARRHRKTLDHKRKAFQANKLCIKEEEIQELFEMKSEKSSKSVPAKTELNATILKHNAMEDKPCTSEQAKLQTIKQTPDNAIHHDIENISHDRLEFHEETKQHFCIVCGRNFKSAQELGRHTRNCQPTIIGSIDPKQLEQLKEITNDQGEKIWLCDLCDFKANLQSEIIYHRAFHSYGTVGKNQLLPCPLCDKTFRKHSLLFHLQNHTKEKLHKCKFCESTFSRPSNLKDHIKNLHSEGQNKTNRDKCKDKLKEKLFACTSCKNKIFKSKHSLQMHCLTHHPEEETTAAKDRPLFKCTQENCEYYSVSKYLLTVHMNSHSMENFKCQEKDCNYVGKSKLHLRRHLQSHADLSTTKLFSCLQCPFKTKIKGHLKRHMNQHTGEKPYPCPYCSFHSTSWENLRKHILKTDKHKGKYVFECKKCKELVATKTTSDESAEKEIFKTNSHQEYQKHLKKAHV